MKKVILSDFVLLEQKALEISDRDRRMDRAARLRVNQGDNEGVDSVSMTEWASDDLPVRLPARRRRR